MPAPAAAKRVAELALKVARALAFFPPLLTRLFLAHAFYFTGKGKLEHPERILSLFKGIGIPAPELNAAFVSRLEYYGAMLLLVGLATRPVAAMLAGAMIVALSTADKDAFVEAFWGRSDDDITTVAPLVLLVGLVWMVIHSPGLLSLDSIAAKWLGVGNNRNGDATK